MIPPLKCRHVAVEENRNDARRPTSRFVFDGHRVLVARHVDVRARREVLEALARQDEHADATALTQRTAHRIFGYFEKTTRQQSDSACGPSPQLGERERELNRKIEANRLSPRTPIVGPAQTLRCGRGNTRYRARAAFGTMKGSVHG